jgi:DNA relaxase NicK
LEECTGQLVEYRRGRNYDLTVCGDVILGHRAEDVMVEMAGDFARTHWREVLPHATNVSRIDLQTTVRFTPNDPYLVEQHYRQAHRRNLTLRKPLTLRGELHQLDQPVMWMGAKGARILGRIYDKSRGGKDPKWSDCWRYEVQYRNEVARAVVSGLAERHDESAAVASTVSKYFEKHGVEVRYTSDNVPVWVARKRKETSRERKLRWLREQVMPTLDTAYAEGWLPECYMALGVPKNTAEMIDRGRRLLQGGEEDVRVLHTAGS